MTPSNLLLFLIACSEFGREGQKGGMQHARGKPPWGARRGLALACALPFRVSCLAASRLREGVGIGQPEFAFFQGSAPAGFFSFFPGGFMSGSSKVLFGFHAVGVRLKVAPASVIEIYVDASRRDARMK